MDGAFGIPAPDFLLHFPFKFIYTTLFFPPINTFAQHPETAGARLAFANIS